MTNDKVVPLDKRGAPDLQLLVQQVGGYDKITTEMWVAFDYAMKQYRLRLGDRNRGWDND
jgi:hypothetical protein